MKKGIYILSLLSAFILIFNACSKEDNPCDGITCLNGGTCISGTCSCPLWITGGNCQTEVRQQYYGTYTGTLTAYGTPQNTSVKVTVYAGKLNFLTWEDVQFMVLTSNSTFSIPDQNNSGYTMKGSGSFVGKTINMTYTIKDDSGSLIDNRTFVGTRK